MKKFFKLIFLAIMTTFLFNCSYVYALEQETENLDERVEEVVGSDISDSVSNSDNKSDNKEEVEESTQEPVVNEPTEEPTVEEPVVEEPTNPENPVVNEEPTTNDIPKNEETKSDEPVVGEPTRGDDEPEQQTVGKVNVRIIDSRTGNAVTTIELLADESSSISVKQLFSSIGDSTFIISETLYTHKFIGFYDALTGGNQITSSYSNSTLYPDLSRITANSTVKSASNYKLTVQAKSDITTETTVDVYARFETTAKPNGKVTINIVDKRTNAVVSSFYSYATDSSTASLLLKDIFPNMIKVSTRLEDTLDGKTYIFKGFFTKAEDGVLIDQNFTPGDNYPELSTFKHFKPTDLANGKLQLKTKTNIAEDATYTIYALWDEKPSTELTVIFKELSESGTELNDTQNEVSESITNTIELGNTQTAKSTKLKVTEFISGNYKYIVDGWYEEDGVTPVSSSMYVNGDPLQIAVPYKCTEDSPKTLTLTYILVWKEYLNPVYVFNAIDEVSDGDHHWDNTDGHFGSYTYTFHKPSDKTHYQFQYYKMDDIIKNPGEEYTHDISGQGYGTEVEETFYAWWKADITLLLFDGNNELGRKSQFDSISPKDVLENDPEKIGYTFLGWEDESGNLYSSEEVFKANDPATNPEPITVKLTAMWDQIMINVQVTKKWDDSDDADQIRPDSVTVHINNKSGLLDTAVLSEDNDWTYTFNVPMYDGEEEAEFTFTEDEVPEYDPEVTGSIEEGYIITNTYIPQQRDIYVHKTWDDRDDYEGLRPDSVTVILYANGDPVDEVILDESNEWEFTWEGLNYNESGTMIEYTIEEEAVEGYDTEIQGSVDKGFEIINTHSGTGGDVTPIDEDVPVIDNPQTADNIYIYIAMIIACLMGLFTTSYAFCKNK